jgi:protein-L-isoaspartate(D-aspartate) O-methyltransferase
LEYWYPLKHSAGSDSLPAYNSGNGAGGGLNSTKSGGTKSGPFNFLLDGLNIHPHRGMIILNNPRNQLQPLPFLQIGRRNLLMKKLLALLMFPFLWLACSQPISESHTLTPIPSSPSPAEEENPYMQLQKQLVKEISAMGVQDEAILRIMASVPRHKFVPLEYLDQAYDNHPLPIGYGQTISQPYIVAWMTELLELQPGEKVLEIGTGSGYQAAILAELGDIEVYSIEIVPELAESAIERLQDLGYTNINVKQGDGYYGWEEYAPFDAIIVTAAPDHLPAPLVDQLSDTGRLVIPIGPPGWVQTLWKFVKQGGEVKGYNLGGVQFVPFTGSGIQESSESTAIP